MMRRLALLALFAGGAMAAAPAAATWQKAQSRHFIIYADDEPARVAAFATRLEKYDAALRTIFGLDDDAAVASRRVTIFVVGGQGDVEHLYGKGGQDIAGFYEARSSGSVAFVPRIRHADKWDLSGEQVLLHEYAHHFMFEHWSETPSPGWLVEGFAEFNATTVFDKDGSVEIGGVPLYRGWQLLNPTLSTRRMLEAQVSDLQGEQRATLYARGWLLTHYLITQPQHHKLYAAYIAALNAGKSPLDAANAAFGDVASLDRELRAYMTVPLRGFRLTGDQLQIAPVTVEPLSAGAAAIMPALMMTWRGVDEKSAAKTLALAQKLAAPYPDDPAVLDELAEAELDADKARDALAIATRAAAADPTSIHARLYQGRAAMRLAIEDKTTDPARWQQARQYFLAANRIDHDNAEALRLYFATFIEAHTAPTKNAQDALLRACDIAPFDLGLRMTAAGVLLNRNETARARTILASIAYDPHAGQLSNLAATIVAAIDKGDSAAALEALKSPKTADQDKNKKS